MSDKYKELRAHVEQRVQYKAPWVGMPPAVVATLLDERDALLSVCAALVKQCDENQPAGEALYFVQQARELVVATKGKS